MTKNESYYLELDKHFIRFDPVSAVNNVFYDDANTQVFAVRSGGETGVVVKGSDPRQNATFRLQDRGGSLISVKFSYQHQILAIQRSDDVLSFANFNNGVLSTTEYSQPCKGKHNTILTFHWLTCEEIVIVTRIGIGYYLVNAEKRSLKLLKDYKLNINWSIFSPESAVLLCSSGEAGSLLVPFHFKNNQVFKLPKFDVDRSNKSTHMELQEKDINLLNLYGNLYAAVLRQPLADANDDQKAHLHLYLLSREVPAKRTHILHLGTKGRFAVNMVDSLVIVHHQSTKVSMLFDIKLNETTSQDGIVHVKPVVMPISIKPYKFIDESPIATNETNYELYSPTWIVFQPNIIIDAAIGCMWFLKLKLKAIAPLFDDVSVLIDFLLQRSVSKPVLLRVIKQIVMGTDKQVSLQTISLVFNKLNKVYKEFRDAEDAYLLSRKTDFMEQSSPPKSLPPLYPSHRLQVVVDHSDMYTNILSQLAEQNDIDKEYICAVLCQYIQSLHQHSLPIKPYLEELLVKTLVKSERYFQIEQLLRLNVLHDTKHLAAYLVKIADKFPNALHYALHMYERLTSCNDEIIDVLLMQGKVMSGLRFARHAGMQDTVSARKFLEAANKIDRIAFYETYKYFETRNYRLRGNKDFKPGELCEEYVQQFKEEFDETEDKTKVQ